MLDYDRSSCWQLRYLTASIRGILYAKDCSLCRGRLLLGPADVSDCCLKGDGSVLWTWHSLRRGTAQEEGAVCRTRRASCSRVLSETSRETLADTLWLRLTSTPARMGFQNENIHSSKSWRTAADQISFIVRRDCSTVQRRSSASTAAACALPISLISDGTPLQIKGEENLAVFNIHTGYPVHHDVAWIRTSSALASVGQDDLVLIGNILVYFRQSITRRQSAWLKQD